MRRTSATAFHVASQGRVYAAVIGVTVGMLFAGVAVPLAFGRTAGTASGAQSVTPALQPAAPNAALPTIATTHSVAGLAGTSAVVGSKRPGTVANAGSAAGSTGTIAGPGAVGGTGQPSGVHLTATDQGVTATAVKLGVVLLDIRALEPLGFAQPHFTPAEQQSQYQAFIDEVNKNGGLLGRKIVPDYKTYNALDTSGSQSGPAICVQLAEDDKVFAAIGVLGGGMDTCLTEQYGIPAISNSSQIAEVYTKSHNLLASMFATLERGAADWGDLAVRNGLVKGRKTGTVHLDTPDESRPEQALVDSLAADGQPVTYRANLASDQATAQSQMPVEIQKMQAAGVDTVFLSTNFVVAIQFAQTAEKQGFKPQYVVSDIGSLTAQSLLGSMPASFGGAYGFTMGVPTLPETAQDGMCRKTFNQATGNSYPPGNESSGTEMFCWMVKTFSAAARLAGAHLTRQGVATAFQHLTIDLGHTLPGSFGPNKTDYADYMRMIQFVESCKCYHDLGAAERGKY